MPFLLLALGNSTPLYGLFTALPVAGRVRYPEKYVAGALLLWAALDSMAGSLFLRLEREMT